MDKKKRTWKMLVSAFVAAFMAAAFILALPGKNVSAIDGSCDIENSSNIDANSYLTYADVVKSYLHLLNNGNIMKVQYQEAGTATSAVPELLIQYYDKDYKFINSKVVQCDLPLFGGFYGTSTNYYILSGQKNPDEDNSVEVFRITKYDLDWNRISSVGLYGANTTIPFNAGSARFDSYENYIVIRTCHQMYKSKDGKNHQANVTILLDAESMVINDSVHIIANSSLGYCSHSFNQFIKLDYKCVVGVDHGDAHPRSVAVLKSGSTDLTQISTSWYSKDMFPISGNTGDNYTGVSVGGFEISSDNYIVVGNSVDQANAASCSTRNIFVSVIPRNGVFLQNQTAAISYLTNYPEGNISTGTPVLVKIDDNRFLVMWATTDDIQKYSFHSSNESGDDLVSYVEIDKDGKVVKGPYTMKGHLSDCQPIIVNNYIVWYTLDNNHIDFYRINIGDITKTSNIQIEEGHKIPESTVADQSTGVVSYTCEKCGKRFSFTVPTEYSELWGTVSEYSVYHGWVNTTVNVGDTVYLWMKPEDLNVQFEKTYEVSGSDKCQFTPSELGGILKMMKPGKFTLTIYPKYYPYFKVTKTFTIKGVVNITEQPEDYLAESGGLAYFSVKAEGTDLKYLWQYKLAGSDTWVDWTSKTTPAISIAYAAYRDGMSVRCLVKDESGFGKTSNEAVLKYKEAALAITNHPKNAEVDATQSSGIAYFEVKATGTGLKYLWQYKLVTASGWTDWKTKTTAKISVAYASYRDGMSLRCIVTDSSGNKLTSNSALLTYKTAFALTKQPVNVSVNEKELAYFEIKATGKGLKYLWQYKLAGNSEWTDWNSKTTASINVAYAAYRDGMSLRCVVTDSNQNRIISDPATLTYIIPLAITTQPSNVETEKNSLAYFEIKAGGKGLKYLWQYKLKGDSEWTDWTTKTTAKISVAYAAYRDGMSLRCVITDASGQKLTSNVVKLNYK